MKHKVILGKYRDGTERAVFLDEYAIPRVIDTVLSEKELREVLHWISKNEIERYRNKTK